MTTVNEKSYTRNPHSQSTKVDIVAVIRSRT
jgi:hypothetical protein